ncbi:MAG: LptA/OstA family protein [Alphaproteobacteria bacterium]
MTRDAIITQQLGGRRALFTAFVVMTAIAFISAIFAAAPSAHAQAPSTALSKNFQANSGKPIDIQSDMLEVNDNKKIATFRGSVIAIQGGFKLRSNELVVLYSTSTPRGTRPAKVASSSAGSGELRQIQAKGNVVITTEDKQQATGELAVFQVQKQLVLLTGNVKVMQGGNIIACEKVVANLATGITTMVPKKRIRAIFQTGTPKSK